MTRKSKRKIEREVEALADSHLPADDTIDDEVEVHEVEVTDEQVDAIISASCSRLRNPEEPVSEMYGAELTAELQTVFRTGREA